MSRPINQNEEFYLDVTRYTYDYLFDNEKKELVIHLQKPLDKTVMSTLLKKAFLFEKTKWTDYVLIKMHPDGLLATFVSKQDSLNMEEYLMIIYTYAKSEDKKISNMTQSKLFEKVIRSGFSRLGISSTSDI